MAANADELRLRIEHGSDPITGSLGLPDGRALRFVAYLQLVGYLEDVREPPPEHDHHPSDGEGQT